VHQNDGSYLAHTQGRKHQTNLARRAAKEQREGKKDDTTQQGLLAGPVKKNIIKIGRPGYRITKIRDPKTRQNGLLLQFQFPDITPGTTPRVRFMSAYEQKVEEEDPAFQYFVVAGEPYETVAVKLQAREVDRTGEKFWQWFDEDNKEFWCQLLFKTERDERYSAVPGLAGGRT
jgi:splicing factor 3A subunit 2